MISHISLSDLQRILLANPPRLLPPEGRTRAAVALLLREGQNGLEVLFIERAAQERDPWSGNLAFPGGKVEAGESEPRLAAQRETREELGIDLAGDRCLGRLSDITGEHLPVHVACFVYAVADLPPLRLSAEVRDAFWVSLADLTTPESQLMATFRFGAEELLRPAIRLPIPDKPLLWGITYRLVRQLLILPLAD